MPQSPRMFPPSAVARRRRACNPLTISTAANMPPQTAAPVKDISRARWFGGVGGGGGGTGTAALGGFTARLGAGSVLTAARKSTSPEPTLGSRPPGG